MVNDRGFIRIVEASVSIILVAGVLFFLFAQTREPQIEDFSQMGRDLLTEIAYNESLREKVLQNDEDYIENFVRNKISPTISFEIQICEINVVCGKESYTETDVFASERIISSTLTNSNSTKLKIFIWRE